MNRILTSKQIDEFIENGVLVIPNVLTQDEMNEAKQDFYHTLLSKYHCDINNLRETCYHLKQISSTGGAGGILDIFYEDWKLKLNQHPKIFQIFTELWSSTWADLSSPRYYHPFGRFNPNQGYMYIDRVCFRVPDEMSMLSGTHRKRSLQRSLTPHLDCCPHNMYGSHAKEYPKWKPIQAFVSLTDTIHENEGGFEACLGHHVVFEQWAKNRTVSNTSHSTNYKDRIESPPCVGDFTPIRPIEDKEVIEKFCSIPCRSGDLVCWDYRIPHANSRHNYSLYPREVVYIGFLPGIERNRQYAVNQLERYRQGLVPTDQWHEHTEKQECSFEFSALGRKLMTIDSFDL